MVPEPPAASTEASLEIPQGKCVLTYDPLNVDNIRTFVADDGAGATVVFIGTTRNSFEGKRVTRLEYQAYSQLAIKTLAEILQASHDLLSHSAFNQEPDISSLIRCAIYHRLGTVPVGEPSIVIAVSSPRRKLAFIGCEMILEEVKRKAQIWKREYYEGERGEEAAWKANDV